MTNAGAVMAKQFEGDLVPGDVLITNDPWIGAGHFFGEVAVLHSHLTPAERHAQWREIAAGGVNVVVGARSAIFAPAPRLGLIVIEFQIGRAHV